jgi:hypothetical protein
MGARASNLDRLASILLWAGRTITGVWALIFLISLVGEVAGGYQPGGSAFTSIFNFASGGLLLLGVAASFWRPWVGGVLLIIEWTASCLSLVLGLEPQANVPTGLVIASLTMLLPGLCLLAASMIRHRKGER